MGWKNFWIKNSQKLEGYCVNSYGALNKLTIKSYESVWLKYEDIMKILNLKNGEERCNLCDKLFNEKFPQSEKDKKELSKQEQSSLEKLFP